MTEKHCDLCGASKCRLWSIDIQDEYVGMMQASYHLCLTCFEDHMPRAWDEFPQVAREGETAKVAWNKKCVIRAKEIEDYHALPFFSLTRLRHRCPRTIFSYEITYQVRV